MAREGASRRQFVRGFVYLLTASALVIIAALLVVLAVEPQISYTPDLSETLTPEAGHSGFPVGGVDILGEMLGPREVERLRMRPEGSEMLDPANGAIAVTPELLRLGRKAFYEESFGSEVFLSEVLGILDGPLNILTLGRAILGLHGDGTTNLRVRLDRDIRIGGRLFHEGEVVNTGLDVPPGRYLPLGVTLRLSRQGVQMGITCAACHAVVDPAGGKVIEGAPNADLDTGLLLALAPNSAAFFKHTGARPDDPDMPRSSRTVPLRSGGEARLPDVQAFERAVDAELLRWPAGNFDSTWDLVNDPSQIPDSYTWRDSPYSWSGAFSAGPFQGLFAFTSNVHAGNSDMFTVMESSSRLLGLERGVDEELYIATLLQNAANPAYRLPEGAARPSHFFRQIDPTPRAAGMNELIPMPGFPWGSPLSPTGLLSSSPGLPAGRQAAAIAAWQHTLQPPPPAARTQLDPLAVRGRLENEERAEGRRIFVEAGCARCHSGVGGSGQTVVSARVVGTEPARAKAMKRIPNNFASGPPRLWSFDTPVPLPTDRRTVTLEEPKADARLRNWPFARDEEAGAYKVPGLIGLGVSAPYLHDGGGAVAPRAVTFNTRRGWALRDPDGLGMSGSVERGLPADPGAGLLALIDRGLRAKVIAANRAEPALSRAHVTGAGHPFWVDAGTGFTPVEQRTLIRYLLAWRYSKGE